MGARHLKPVSDPPTPSEAAQLKRQLVRVESAFYDENTLPRDLKALSVEVRELRALLKAAEAAEDKSLSVVSEAADDPLT
jgi:hypothetical protein